MIKFYIKDIDGLVIKQGQATNEAAIYAQAKESDTVVLHETPPDPFEQFKEKE